MGLFKRIWRALFGRKVTPLRPAEIIHWHGYRALLDKDGRVTTQPVGLDDLLEAGVTAIVAPQNGGDYLYVAQKAGIKVIRGLEQRWNPGLFQRDLSAILLEFKSPDYPGDFLQEVVDNVRPPCDGFAWNLEHDILNSAHYPLTVNDLVFAGYVNLDKDSLKKEKEYVLFRCLQFAILHRLIYYLISREHEGCTMSLVYTGYAGLTPPEVYGVHWRFLEAPLAWRNIRLPPVTHAMCSWPNGDLPPLTQEHSIPVLHNIATHPSSKDALKEYERVLRDRLKKMKAGDGIGMVHAKMGPEGATWLVEDALRCKIVGKALRSLK